MGAAYRCSRDFGESIVAILKLKKAPMGTEVPMRATSRISRIPNFQSVLLASLEASAYAVTVLMTLSSSLPTPILVRVTSTSQPPLSPLHRFVSLPSEMVISSDVLQ